MREKKTRDFLPRIASSSHIASGKFSRMKSIPPPFPFFIRGSDLRHLFPSSSSTSASSLLCFVFLDHRKREERYRHRQTERSSSMRNSTAFPNILILIQNVHHFQHYFEFLTLISILHKVGHFFKKKVCQIPLPPDGGGWCDME